MTNPTNDDARDYIRELVEPYTHSEPYWTDQRNRRARTYTHRHPSLLDQLRAVCEPGTHDDTGSRGGKSKPPVALSALDVLLRIEMGSAVWVGRRLDLKLRDTVEANLLLLNTHTKDHRLLARDVESWWRWARVESHWDGRPRDLRDPCPYCGQRMLRVAWDVSAAWCRECGADWGRADVGVLGAMLDDQRGDLVG